MAILVKKIYKNKPRWYIQENNLVNGKLEREFLALRGPGMPKYFNTKQDARDAISKYMLISDYSKSPSITLKTARDKFITEYRNEVASNNISKGTFGISVTYSQRLIRDI